MMSISLTKNRSRLGQYLLAWAMFLAGASAFAEVPSDFKVEIEWLNPKVGSTMKVHDEIVAKLKYRYSQPAQPLLVWIKVLDPSLKSTYSGSIERLSPGAGTAIRQVTLDAPGKVKTLTVVVKTESGKEVFAKDFPVDFTYRRNAALEAQQGDGKGSKITAIRFLDGKRAKYRAGESVEMDLDYVVTTPRGVYANTEPVTKCASTPEASIDQLYKRGTVPMGFKVGEPCQVDRVRVTLFNVANVVVYEEFVDVDFRFTN
ncbi:MAG: hypothetical protein ACJ8GW_06225 [Massilia sp.]